MEFVYDMEDGKLDSASVQKEYWSYNKKGNVLTNIEYNRFDADSAHNNKLKRIINRAYDSLERETSYEIRTEGGSYENQFYRYFNDDKGNLIKKTIEYSGNTSYVKSTEHYYYDNNNNKIKSIDTNYHSNDTIVITLFYVYDKNGNLLEENDDEENPFGRKIRYGYDKKNRLISWDDESYGCGNRVSVLRYKYDKHGNKIQEKSKYMNIWSVQDFTYNDKNQLILEESYSEKHKRKWKTYYYYNENGDVMKVESFDSKGELNSVKVYEYGYY